MKSTRLTLLFVSSVISLARVAVAMPACDVSATVPERARVFAKSSETDRWQEYRSTQDIPGSDSDVGPTAQFWKDETGAPSAYFVESTEDFWIYTRYCFTQSGRLQRIGFEVRTAWGWGYRLRGSFVGSGLRRDSSEFFDTKNEKAIPKPEGAADIPDALKPELYRTTQRLPFASLLERIPNHGRKQAPSASP